MSLIKIIGANSYQGKEENGFGNSDSCCLAFDTQALNHFFSPNSVSVQRAHSKGESDINRGWEEEREPE